MAPPKDTAAESLLANDKAESSRVSVDSTSSASTISLVFDRINDHVEEEKIATRRKSSRKGPYADSPERLSVPGDEDERDDFDEESGPFLQKTSNPHAEKNFRRLTWILGSAFLGSWLLALIIFIGREAYRHSSEFPHDPAATASRGNGKQITLDQIMAGQWSSQRHNLDWIEGPNGEDGLLLERGVAGKDYLVVEDVRARNGDKAEALETMSLMKKSMFTVNGQAMTPRKVWPSKNLKKVLIATDVETNWRHSFYAKYWIFDVESQTAEALDPDNLDDRIQLASWSPQSDAVAFTRDSNLFIRKLSSKSVTQITQDGGTEYFYGVPDWVYEEEVFGGNSATWWAEDGKYLAFLRTNESSVPEFPVPYFLSRPSGTDPVPGEENYPETRQIKYPKAGAPNPTVDLLFYDVAKEEVFEVDTEDNLGEDRLITEVLWAGSTGKALIRETNRESDVLSIVLVDVLTRSGKTIRTDNVTEIDGGWFEVSENTRYIPADPANGRPYDGYIDTVIKGDYDHLGYFTPLDNPDPIYLTSGDWEVVDAPSAVDLENNLVYFVSTKESSIQRHVYSVKLDGTDMKPLTDTSEEAYYQISFSSGAGYALLDYKGPNIPWQKVLSTPSNKNNYEKVIEDNPGLKDMAAKHELPILRYEEVIIDGYRLNLVEQLPPHFNENKKYPVLFFMYGGPGSQTVNKQFSVNFQSYVAANLGYIVVTLDGRGTGYVGRKARCIIRDNIGYYEAYDQIETADLWSKKKYVDASRIAIWGWSYGGFLTLKTLEQDGGEIFSYGMAVAPVTDWRFYDSIYTERYMHTPQHNPTGYTNSAITDVEALGSNVRFLIMHGVSDDNVHFQNTLTLLDKLDLAGIENYDVHVFPDSDHSIYFHNANRIVYDKLSNWLINAFNGEWLRVADVQPMDIDTA